MPAPLSGYRGPRRLPGHVSRVRKHVLHPAVSSVESTRSDAPALNKEDEPVRESPRDVTMSPLRTDSRREERSSSRSVRDDSERSDGGAQSKRRRTEDEHERERNGDRSPRKDKTRDRSRSRSREREARKERREGATDSRDQETARDHSDSQGRDATTRNGSGKTNGGVDDSRARTTRDDRAQPAPTRLIDRMEVDPVTRPVSSRRDRHTEGAKDRDASREVRDRERSRSDNPEPRFARDNKAEPRFTRDAKAEPRFARDATAEPRFARDATAEPRFARDEKAEPRFASEARDDHDSDKGPRFAAVGNGRVSDRGWGDVRRDDRDRTRDRREPSPALLRFASSGPQFAPPPPPPSDSPYSRRGRPRSRSPPGSLPPNPNHMRIGRGSTDGRRGEDVPLIRLVGRSADPLDHDRDDRWRRERSPPRMSRAGDGYDWGDDRFAPRDSRDSYRARGQSDPPLRPVSIPCFLSRGPDVRAEVERVLPL